jgi:hypothetical protein
MLYFVRVDEEEKEATYSFRMVGRKTGSDENETLQKKNMSYHS